jgi:hypothetical protein
MHRGHHGYTDLIDGLLPREFSVLFVVFLNHRVTHLRVHDASDGFRNIQKHRVMICDRGNHFDKVRNSFGGV